jgi:hypothetical protein
MCFVLIIIGFILGASVGFDVYDFVQKHAIWALPWEIIGFIIMAILLIRTLIPLIIMVIACVACALIWICMEPTR